MAGLQSIRPPQYSWNNEGIPMKKSTILKLLSCAFLSIPMTTFAQITFSTVTARVGVIRTEWPDGPIYSSHLWSFYPELEAGGTFLLPSLSWGLSWGYWTDGIDQPLPVADFVTYSQSSHIIATRIGFRPDLAGNRMPVPLTLFVGVSEHITKLSYVGGTGFDGNRGQTFSEHSAAGFVGLALSYPLFAAIDVQLEGLQYISFGRSWLDRAQKYRQAFKFGLAMTLWQ
jgi:hypothetical protein